MYKYDLSQVGGQLTDLKCHKNCCHTIESFSNIAKGLFKECSCSVCCNYNNDEVLQTVFPDSLHGFKSAHVQDDVICEQPQV